MDLLALDAKLAPARVMQEAKGKVFLLVRWFLKILHVFRFANRIAYVLRRNTNLQS